MCIQAVSNNIKKLLVATKENILDEEGDIRSLPGSPKIYLNIQINELLKAMLATLCLVLFQLYWTL